MQTKQNQSFFDKIIEAGCKKELSRRDFMTQAMAAGLTLTSAATLWTESVSAQTPQKRWHL